MTRDTVAIILDLARRRSRLAGRITPIARHMSDILGTMVSERDKARMSRLAHDLAAGESHDRGTPEQRAQIMQLINANRSRHGAEELIDRAPEEGLYDRAKSLGMARIDR